ncbi:hypothetical protein D9615_002680 [Tricholomella constricta]|uniref:HIT-type domain-containing protein n=1 Tax=Tricholomella constricta TaxID=117010 RepID=A0A8H5M9H5_9AGAR|nr:hypothetical protein D9615_002680 [Tricholomella constricta]
MPPRRKPAKCDICSTNESKYTCSACMIVYCSVACYKRHKEETCTGHPAPGPSRAPQAEVLEPQIPKDDEPPEPHLEDPKPLRPLTSLKWPYIPDESAYPDPLKRDDPKTIQLHQYEAIATSPAIRKTLAAHPNLKKLLTSIDSLRGSDRERALQYALGVAAPDIKDLAGPAELSDDTLALRELAEAIEVVVRGGQEGGLGLDWDPSG